MTHNVGPHCNISVNKVERSAYGEITKKTALVNVAVPSTYWTTIANR